MDFILILLVINVLMPPIKAPPIVAINLESIVPNVHIINALNVPQDIQLILISADAVLPLTTTSLTVLNTPLNGVVDAQ